MKYCSILSILILLGVTFSCEKDLDVSLIESKPFNVVYSLFTTDSTWTVDLTKSAGALESYPQLSEVKDAVVSVYNSEGNRIETLSYVPQSPPYKNYSIRSNYRGKTSPQAEETYTLKIELPDGSITTATSQIPQVVPILSVEMDSSHYASKKDVEMILTFTDPKETKNFYQLMILRKRTLVNYIYAPKSVPTIIDSTYTYTEDIFQFFSIDLTDEIRHGTVFTDQTFNGKKNTWRFAIGRPGGYNVNKRNPNPIRVVLMSVPESYYNYFSAATLAVENKGNPLAQPVQIPTNVENGLGLFAGYATSEVKLN